MTAWFSRLFRSRTETLAEKAEVEGRFEDAARLFAESGSREDSFRVLMRAAECSTMLSERRGLVARAYTVAPTPDAQMLAKRALAEVTLAECEASAPRDDEERGRLAAAADELERSGAFREAARAFKLLGERESVERVLMLAGDVEAFEREAGADHELERRRLRRRNATESFEMNWRSGDRARAIEVLEQWVKANPEDADARALLRDRGGELVREKSFEARFDGVSHVLVGALPATLGREADVVVRGASVSREHCAIESHDADLVVRDNGSRNGTQLDGLVVAGVVPIAGGHRIALGADLTLWVVSASPAVVVLEIERGMDRGRRIVFVRTVWDSPVGPICFRDKRWTLEPRGAVQLAGQRVVSAITLARGDRVDAGGTLLEVIR